MIRRWVIAAFFAFSVIGLVAAEAEAQRVQPWIPPWADSLVVWTARARVRFETNTGDSIGGDNYHAYELVGAVGRRLLRSLGRENLSQAHAVEAVLDSAGLDTEVWVDSDIPIFALLMVRNPFRSTAKAVGFMYWYRGEDLRMQGLQFLGGESPRMKVWWKGSKDWPYSWGIVDRERTREGEMSLMLLRLSPDGYYWTLGQYPGKGPHLGGPGDAAFVDINRDHIPELVVWTEAPTDSLFETCEGCQGLIGEAIYVEREGGFELHDSRLLPSPYSTFLLFVRMLRAGDRAGASRLVDDSRRVAEAFSQGWGEGKGRGVWRLEAVESADSWPRWLRLRHRGPKGPKSYTVHFVHKDGRWVIRDWSEIQPPSGVTPDSAAEPRSGGPGTP